MKISIVSLTGIDSSTGKRNLFLARELVKLGHKVKILSFDWDHKKGSIKKRNKIVQGVRVKNIYAGKNILGILVNGTIKLFRNMNADVYILSKPLAIHSLPFLIAKKFRKGKFVLDSDDWEGIGCAGSFKEVGFKKRLLATFFEEYIPRKADGVMAASKVILKRTEDMGVRNLLYLPNASDTKDFSFNNEDREKIRTKYKIKDTEKVFMYMGSFNSPMVLKGLRLFIKACSEVKKPFKLILAGDGKLMKNLHKIIEKNKMQDKTIFTGFLTDELRAHLCAADIAIIPYPTYYPYTMRVMTCSPRKLYEYMAIGLPVMANGLGEFKVSITDKRMLIDTEDNESLKNIIEKTISLSSSELKKIGEQNKRKINEEFNLKKQGKAVDKFLKNL